MRELTGGDIMKIDSSHVQMNSVSTMKTSFRQTERLTISQNQGSPQSTNAFQDQLDLSKESLFLAQNTEAVQHNEPLEDTFEFEISEEDKEKISLLKKLLESLTGKKVNFYVPKKIKGKKLKAQGGNSLNNVAIRREHFTHYKEKAKMSFETKGQVTTEDGRTIDFNLNLHLERSFEATNYTVSESGGLQDPLTINFDAPSANLTNEKYAFDLTPGGEMEEISFVKGGSGFLAIDKNQDGKINDGSELFGPNSGNGFLELAAFDDDGNGWIDENDDVFDDLLIWTKDTEGNDQLFGLLKKDVGAIFLGNVQTQYGLKDSGNNLLGQIASTGIFLKESGGVGTVQHIDLSV